jgi:hypothetical protein
MPRAATPPPLEEATAPAPEVKLCQAPGCETPLPTSGPGWHWRRFCDTHKPADTKKKKAPARRPDRPPKALAPPAPPKARTRKEELDQVEKNAKFILDMVCQFGLIYAGSAGQPALAADLGDVQNGVPGIAKSLRNVAEYEEWLRRALSGGRGSDRAQAWLGLVMVCGAVTMPILVRHGKLSLPPGMAQMLLPNGPAGAPTFMPDAADDEPIPA